MLSRKIRAYKEANPKAKAKEIAAALGAKVPYVYQVLNYKSVKPKKSKPTDGQQSELTNGQHILRKEITRLNEDVDSWRDLYFGCLDELEQLNQDVVGYRAVISYLQGQIDGITV
jgi:hypothetical protein